MNGEQIVRDAYALAEKVAADADGRPSAHRQANGRRLL
jgi:hypothetical protein